MFIEKQNLIKKLESLTENLGKQVSILAKDLCDVILFLSIYGGNNLIKAENLQIKMFGLTSPKIQKPNYNKDGKEKKVQKTGNVEAILYNIKSYDNVINLNLTISKMYLKIEKEFEDETNYYLSEYIFDESGNFVRNAKQNSYLLGKRLSFNEISKGCFSRGVCFSTIEEEAQNLHVKFFKILTSKGEEVFYSYLGEPNMALNYKVPKTITTIIPSISSMGMKELNELFELQFSQKFKSIDDFLYKELEKSAKEIFMHQKK